MNTSPLLVTEELTPSLRLASALVLSGSRAPTTATFSRGRQPAAALLGCLGIRPRSLPESTARAVEEMLVGACRASQATDLIMWACTRGAAAVHALRHLPDPPRVTYVLPREGTSPWDEAAVVATRAGNLIHRFVSTDPVTTRRLLDIGIPNSRIAMDWNDGAQQAAPGGARRVILIHGLAPALASEISSACAASGMPCSRATTAAAVAIALGLGGRPGHMVIDSHAVESISPLLAMMRSGWIVTVVGDPAIGSWPPALVPCPPIDVAVRVTMHGGAR